MHRPFPFALSEVGDRSGQDRPRQTRCAVSLRVRRRSARARCPPPPSARSDRRRARDRVRAARADRRPASRSRAAHMPHQAARAAGSDNPRLKFTVPCGRCDSPPRTPLRTRRAGLQTKKATPQDGLSTTTTSHAWYRKREAGCPLPDSLQARCFCRAGTRRHLVDHPQIVKESRPRPHRIAARTSRSCALDRDPVTHVRPPPPDVRDPLNRSSRSSETDVIMSHLAHMTRLSKGAGSACNSSILE